MSTGMETVRILQRVFADQDVPPGVLADVWREAVAHPGEAAANLLEDIRLIWERADLRELSPPDADVPLAVRAGLVAMCWTAQFVLLARRTNPLRDDVRQTTANFFQQFVAETLPTGPRRATALRVYINARREPSFGGLVIEQQGAFYAVYGPQPGTTELSVARCSTQTAAVVAVMRFLTSVTKVYLNLTPAGTINYAAADPDGQPLLETCPRCQSPVGPTGVCYPCEGMPVPAIADPTETQRVRESARGTIFDALGDHGVSSVAASRIWQEAQEAPLPDQGAQKEAVQNARLLLSLLGLPETLLRGLGPNEMSACSRLYLLASTGRDALRELAQRCHQLIVVENLSGARRLAAQHDRLAQGIGDTAILGPLVAAYAAARVEETARRPVSLLVSARTGNPRAVSLLAKYLQPQYDLPTQLAALKSLQWMAELTTQAMPAITEALRHPASPVRLAGTHALGITAAWGRVPPAALLGQLAQSDWNPLVRQGAITALALGGPPPCPACGQSLAAGASHECLAYAETLESLLPPYEQALLGLRPAHAGRVKRVVQVLIESEDTGLAQQADVVAELLQQNVAAGTRLHALAALAALRDAGNVMALLPLLRSTDLVVSLLATAAMLRSGIAATAHPDLVLAVQANAATMAFRGQLHLAARALPATAEGVWGGEYPALETFFSTIHCCPVCGALSTAAAPHRCQAPIEAQLEALSGIEHLLVDAHVTGHPLASRSLLAQYNVLAATMGIPPHPRCPMLPSSEGPLATDVLDLLTGQEQDRRIQVVRSWAKEGSLLFLLSLATVLHNCTDEDLQQAVVQALGKWGLGLCPDCLRLVPLQWPHQCQKVPAPEVVIPASWQEMMGSVPEALGRLADEPVGQLFAYVIQQDPALHRLGVTFSRLHALLAEDPSMIPPAAMVAQLGSQWFAITGPSAEGELVVEEYPDRQSAYRSVRAFLQQEAERVVRAEKGLMLSLDLPD